MDSGQILRHVYRACASARFPRLRAAAAIASLLLPVALFAVTPPPIVVGSLTLSYCNTQYNGYCGAINRPLDPTGVVAGTISIGFEFYPRTDQTTSSLGTILTQEGGPGYSSTDTRDAYIGLYSRLRNHRDILIVDKRGTGLSGAINCSALQNSDLSDPVALAACGTQLGRKAWLYGTKFAVDDVVAVLDALAVDRADYYGDSYGTYFGEVFAAYHPSRLRSIVLDSAYPVRPPDVWFPTDYQTDRDGFDLVCQRSPSCAALGSSPTTLIRNLLNSIRVTPLTGTAADADGVKKSVKLNPQTLFLVMINAGNTPAVYRELDAAVRAWFDRGDRQPLLRLVAEATTGGASDPTLFSAGLYTAVICQEYPLLYNLASSPTQRRTDYQAAIAQTRAARPDLFAPFTLDEVLASNADITPLDVCLDWPAPPPGFAQGDPLPAQPVFPAVPTLVLSGDLDGVTSRIDAAQAASQFPDVTHLIIPNLTHITAFSIEGSNFVPGGADLTHCVSTVVLNFVSNLTPGDTSCTPKVRPIRTVPHFVKSIGSIAAAKATTGNKGGTTQLRIAAAATETVGDVIARFYVGYGFGRGLRGGTFSYSATSTGYKFVLNKVKWTNDLEVSGTVTWNMVSNAISSQLTLIKSAVAAGSLTVSWNDQLTNANATISGTINSLTVKAKRIAP
jgi:pimeloyl-ACP methyl ester carboxylesterase